MTAPLYPRIASLKTADAFRSHLTRHGIALDFDADLSPPAESPFARSLESDGLRVGNRFCILPMEGWDGTRDGQPSDLTFRRWRNFGRSGAKLIWGGEAVAVRHDGRANPHQLLMTGATQPAIAALRDELVRTHRATFGAAAADDLLVGLQLTHSGRYAKPDEWDRPTPLAACPHPVLDRRFPMGVRVLSDDELDRLVEDFVAAARLAASSGFQFVDFKHCHGYLGHELLGARNRRGPYGGPLTNRFTFLTRVIDAIRTALPGLMIGVRLSVFDSVPYRKGPAGVGVPEVRTTIEGPPMDVRPGFGVVDDENLDAALDDSRALLTTLQGLGVRWICVTAGSPYYCPHVQRPAYFPPSDGYQPPEDPLHGVARQIHATAILKAAFPEMVFVGSAYSYLQEWLPHVGQYNLRARLTDFVGLGRMVLAYPDLPADVLAGVPLRRQRICRTFSDCTTGPRMAMVSGCYPLDPFYKAQPEAAAILKVRTEQNAEPRR